MGIGEQFEREKTGRIEPEQGRSSAAPGYVALFQLGSFYDAAYVTRVYSAFAKAKEAIPKGFRCLVNLRNGVYAENEQKRQWLKITMYRIDEI
jgi:hypothetical protein